MANKVLRIGTRDSQLALWQANLVKDQLAKHGFKAELVYIKSEGDIDLKTPLYEMGVQGIFTRTLDIALLNKSIDIAVHSMKDVPTQLPKGIVQAAVLQRASYKDLLVYKGDRQEIEDILGMVDGQWALQVSSELSVVSENLSGTRNSEPTTHHSDFPAHGSRLPAQGSRLFALSSPLGVGGFIFATSSIRRKAQWLHRYPNHTLENLRGNVNTRLRKVEESHWNGAIFAAAGLERIDLRPENSIELDWMLPAPAQGAIMIVCNSDDQFALEACGFLNHAETAMCTKVEKDFLRVLMGGCSTPISALAQVINGKLVFKGNILSVDGRQMIEVEKVSDPSDYLNIGTAAANELLSKGGDVIASEIQHAKQ